MGNFLFVQCVIITWRDRMEITTKYESITIIHEGIELTIREGEYSGLRLTAGKWRYILDKFDTEE